MTWRRTGLGLLLVLATQAGCGVAQRAAKGAARGATEAAIQTAAGKVPEREELLGMAEGVTRRSAAGLLSELGRQEQLESIQRIASALAAGSIAGASQAASGALGRGLGAGVGAAAGGPGGERGPPTRAMTPVEALAEQAVRALAQQMVAELGRAGRGPLGSSLAATAGEVAASMARGGSSELGPLLPDCPEGDRAACLDRAVARVSRASAGGLAAGLRESMGVWPTVLAFGGGAASMLVLAWAVGLWRARRAAPS